MEISIIVFLSILLLAFFLFSREVYPLEISALIILLLLVISGILDPRVALSSFGNESIVLIASLFVLISGLKKTGIIKKFEENLILISGDSRNLTFSIILILVAFFSAFVSNTATLAISIPIVVSMAKKFGDAPRQWLMPVAFASVLGGMNTLVGTSTNIIISGLLPDYKIEGFSLFTTAHVGLPILVVGIVFLVIFSRYILPAKKGLVDESIGVKYDIRSYTIEIIVKEDSPLCNQSIANSKVFREASMNVLGVVREGHPLLKPRGSLIIHANDRLIVEANLQNTAEVLDRYGLEFHEDVRSDVKNNQNGKKASKNKDYDLDFHEVLVTNRSRLNNRTAIESFLRSRYRISLIAINRQGETTRERLSDIRMAAGDILVVQFLDHPDNNALDYLGLIPLQEIKKERYRVQLAPYASLIFVLALIIGSVTSIPLAITCLAGAVLMVMTRILRSDEVYEAVHWKVLIFIGGILCLGKGMQASGTAVLFADLLSSFLLGIEPVYALAFFCVTTMIMTQLLSNQATAVVMIPIAINTAQSIGLPVMPFIMAVTMAASCCFITPFEPAFMLVYGPGGYKFTDFFRLGIFLNVLAVVVTIIIIPLVWPL